jgi:nuclear cap-binding protein subunit 1
MTVTDDDDNNYDRRGPHQRRRNDDGPPPNNCRRFEEDPLAKLRRMLLNIAGSAKLPQEEAAEIAKDLGDNLDDDRVREQFFDLFITM